MTSHTSSFTQHRPKDRRQKITVNALTRRGAFTLPEELFGIELCFVRTFDYPQAKVPTEKLKLYEEAFTDVLFQYF